MLDLDGVPAKAREQSLFVETTANERRLPKAEILIDMNAIGAGNTGDELAALAVPRESGMSGNYLSTSD
jgi:hypothetical protein